MCGITGMVHLEQDLRQQELLLRKMQRTLQRRGPDQEGIFLSPQCAMAHTRLAVIDVEKGRQPMEVTAGGETYTIVYNGELYNTAELRTQLEQEGTVFQTHCDTEVLLQSYVHWGPRCVEQCNGIFAFAVWEHSARRLFLARDRIGVKPLFYAEIPNGFVFGSEIKALLQHPDVPHEIDKTGIAELLLMGPGRTAGGGVFRTIREVKPAHCGYYMQGQLHLHPYWELHAAEHTENFADTAAHVRELVTDAVRRQMISDVPIGTFLSGGLDSSLLSSLANQVMQEQGRELHTFSVDYQDNDRYFQKSHFQPTSDPTYIRAMERYLGCRHHWTVLDTPALAEALYAAVDARDLPGMVDVDSSLLLFCREIRQEVTVALSGECADELFGGYPWYRDADIRRINGFPWAQSTAYRTQFLLPEIAAEIDAQAYVQSAYARTVAAAGTAAGRFPAGIPHAGNDEAESGLVHADAVRPERPHEHVQRSGSPCAVLRLPHCGVSLQCSVGVQGLERLRKGTACGRQCRTFCRRKCSGGKRAPIPRPTTPAICRRFQKCSGMWWQIRFRRCCKSCGRKCWNDCWKARNPCSGTDS